MSLYIKHGLIVLVGAILFGASLISVNTVSSDSKVAISLSEVSQLQWE